MTKPNKSPLPYEATVFCEEPFLCIQASRQESLKQKADSPGQKMKVSRGAMLNADCPTRTTILLLSLHRRTAECILLTRTFSQHLQTKKFTCEAAASTHSSKTCERGTL
eukprot:6280630-Amphidinium_carterae.2